MADGFEKAVAVIEESARQYVEDGHFIFPRVNPNEVLHRLYLGIHWIPQSGEQPGYWHASDESIVLLVNQTLNDCAAFDLASQIAGDCLVRGVDIPEELRVFAALRLVGEIQRPKDEKRSITWVRNIYLLTMAQIARMSFDLKLTRSDEKQGAQDSACDAVVAALSRVGHHTTYRAVKELCVGTSAANVKLRQDYRNWIQATLHSVNNDEMGKRLFETSWLCVGANFGRPT